MSLWLEIISVILGVAYVLLAARESVWCWPMGIIGSAIGIWLFVDSKIYAEAFLYTYYVIMGFYGWYAWKEKSAMREATVIEPTPSQVSKITLDVITWPWAAHIAVMLSGYALTFILAWTLDKYTDAQMPMLDSFTTVFSFIATWMVARRVLENWIYWIAIDTLTIYLYISRGLEWFALLSLVYTVLAVYGYIHWSKTLGQKVKTGEHS